MRNACVIGLAPVKVLVCAAFLLASGCGPDGGEPLAPDAPSGSPFWDEVEELYRRAKDAGETASRDATQWAKEDLERIGDWEYRVLAIEPSDPHSIEQSLNVAGEDRWEAFWIHSVEGQLHVYLKRPTRSYLRSVPLSELRRLIPGADSE